MPPDSGIMAPISAYTKPPAIESRPPTIHAARIQGLEGSDFAMEVGVRKMPPPTARPSTSSDVSQRFRPRARPAEELRTGGAHAAAGKWRICRASAIEAGSRPTSRAMRTTRSTKRALESASSPLR